MTRPSLLHTALSTKHCLLKLKLLFNKNQLFFQDFQFLWLKVCPNPHKHARNRLRYLRKVKIILTQRKTDEIKKITSVTAKIFCVNTLTLDVTATER